MFGHHKDHPAAAGAKTPSQSEVAHQFDQTNGVMKAFDDYQARKYGQPNAEVGDDLQKRLGTTSVAAATGMGSLGATGRY